jgi:hypothetical protein
MFFKKKKKKQPDGTASVIGMLASVEFSDENKNPATDESFDRQVAYVNKYFSRNRIDAPRKGIFVNRELVHKLHDYVQVLGQGEASIGAYVEEIILDHFKRNEETLKALFNINTRCRR